MLLWWVSFVFRKLFFWTIIALHLGFWGFFWCSSWELLCLQDWNVDNNVFKSGLCETPFKWTKEIKVWPIAYQVRKKKVWKNHLSLLQKAFYILFLLCIIFWVASFQTDHNFLWGQRLLFLKNAIIIKIMIILWHDLYWSSLTLVHMLRSFVEFLPGAENLTKKNTTVLLVVPESEISVTL